MKTTAYILLVCFMALAMFPGLDTHELMRLGAVAEHYDHHVTEHGQSELSFVEFLVDHFGSESDVDPEHDKLPLHQHAECTGMIACEVDSQVWIFVNQSNFLETTEPPSMISYCEPSAVFQPPRV